MQRFNFGGRELVKFLQFLFTFVLLLKTLIFPRGQPDDLAALRPR